MNERKNNKQQYKQYEKLIKNWFNEQFTAPNGLTLCYPNTGSGKSYQSYLSIAKNLYAYITGEKTSDMTDEEYNARTRRILYVTPNVNYSEIELPSIRQLRSCFQRRHPIA